MKQIDGKLLVPVPSQLMPPIRWRRGDQGQGASRHQDCKAIHDRLGHPSPICLLGSPAEFKVFSSFRVRKAMSNAPPRFPYVIGNALHLDIKGRKLNLSRPASDLRGHDLKVAAEAAAQLRDLRRPPNRRKQEGSKRSKKRRSSKGLCGKRRPENRCAGFGSDHPELRRTSPCYLQLMSPFDGDG